MDPMINILVKQYSSVKVVSKRMNKNSAFSLKGEHKSSVENSMEKEVKKIDTSTNAPLTMNNHLLATSNFLDNSGKAVGIVE